MKFIKIILIIFLNISINNYVHANEKIVFFDVNVLLNETNIGIKTLKIINDLNDKNIQKLKITKKTKRARKRNKKKTKYNKI